MRKPSLFQLCFVSLQVDLLAHGEAWWCWHLGGIRMNHLFLYDRTFCVNNLCDFLFWVTVSSLGPSWALSCRSVGVQYFLYSTVHLTCIDSYENEKCTQCNEASKVGNAQPVVDWGSWLQFCNQKLGSSFCEHKSHFMASLTDYFLTDIPLWYPQQNSNFRWYFTLEITKLGGLIDVALQAHQGIAPTLIEKIVAKTNANKCNAFACRFPTSSSIPNQKCVPIRKVADKMIPIPGGLDPHVKESKYKHEITCISISQLHLSIPWGASCQSHYARKITLPLWKITAVV